MIALLRARLAARRDRIDSDAAAWIAPLLSVRGNTR